MVETAELADEFTKAFGRRPEVGASAPGRVNLIGEHTDYNEGLVMPCAIDRHVVALGALRDDGRIRARARDLGGEVVEFDVSELERRGGWIDYVQGIAFALAERGCTVPGADILVASDLPRESGLSSSAALGVSVTTLLDGLAGLGLSARDRARVAHRGENEFVGVGCGILDQFASALGRRDHALRIDCRSQEIDPVPMPPGRLALLIAHSGVTRTLAGGSYRDRVDECAAALAAAREAGVAPPGASSLRDLQDADLAALEGALGPIEFRRVRHVIGENRRVDTFRAALDAGDLAAAGAVLAEGQRSLRDDYEVSIPELDTLCEVAATLPGVVGSRLTGAGFGGCTLHLVEAEAAGSVASGIAAGFEARTGRRPPILEARPWDGAGTLDVR